MTPACIGIIMDGNRRWATEKGLSKLEGHRLGRKALRRAVEFARERGVAHLVVYGFSTENWNRESTEVSYLMDLFSEAIEQEIEDLCKNGVRVRFVGQRERFSKNLQEAMERCESKLSDNATLTLWVCLSYGGRPEIVEAARAAAASGEEISEITLSKHLWTANMPEPDIIIRTGGEKRLSNFLPWQSVYSELFFTDTYWPDFSEQEFDSILTEYAGRERRRGR
jgi:undecaprenyl diphosphate synthase